MNIFAYILVILSGATGLIYQVLWQKQLSNLFGSHQLATSLVLATFFGFMALGYHLIGRWVSTSKLNRIWIYGFLEGSIGVYALISPFWFYSLTQYHQFVILMPGSNIWSPILFAILLMGFPTFLMGGTIPVLVEGLSQTFETSHKAHSRIYSLNTLGAFFGTLLCGFWMLEKFGINTTLYLSGILNLIIFAATFPYRKKSLKLVAVPKADGKKEASTWVLLGISFLSGFYVFGLENMVIRMAGVALGSTVYTYTIVVGCFILSIALGAAIAGRLNKFPPLRLLWLITLALSVTSVLLYLSVPQWPQWFHRVRFLIQLAEMNFAPYWILIFTLLLLILCVPVGLMGMNLPLLFFYLKSKKSFLSQTVGRLYAVNALGCVLGAFVGGYLLFYWFDGPTVFKFLLFCIFGTLAALSFLPETKKFQRWIWLSTGLCAVFTLISPQWQAEDFSPGLFTAAQLAPHGYTYSQWHRERDANLNQKILFNAYDVNTLVTVVQHASEKSIYVNGKPDASTKGDSGVRALNILVPLLLAPKIDEAFIIGIGGGLSLGLSTLFSEVKHVDVAEISKGVIDALPYFDEENYNLLSRANKFSIFNEDAFSVLQRSTKKYNVIVSEPSNPWVSGVEKLYSLEFLSAASQRLSENGVYVQWFPLFASPPESFLMILKNFNEIFPWVTVWTASPGVAMIVASPQPMNPNPSAIENRFNEHQDVFKKFGLNFPLSFLFRQMLSPIYTKGLSFQCPVFHTLERPRLAYMSGRDWLAGAPTWSLKGLMESIFRKPPSQKVDSAKLLFENPSIKIDEATLKDGIAFDQTKGFATDASLSFHLSRLNFELQKRFPAGQGQALANYQRVMTNSVPETKSSKETLEYLRRWQNLISLQLTSDPKTLESLAKMKCDEKDCKEFLETLTSPSKLKK